MIWCVSKIYWCISSICRRGGAMIDRRLRGKEAGKRLADNGKIITVA
jgi:hypothetical protein